MRVLTVMMKRSRFYYDIISIKYRYLFLCDDSIPVSATTKRAIYCDLTYSLIVLYFIFHSGHSCILCYVTLLFVYYDALLIKLCLQDQLGYIAIS